MTLFPWLKNKDRFFGYKLAIFTIAFSYAFFLSFGLALWDDDFTSWISKINTQTFTSIFLEILSPISTQPEYWGFNERPLEKLLYKLGLVISGRSSWAYFALKSVFFAGMCLFTFLWCERIQASSKKKSSWLSGAITVFFMLSPGVAASHVLLQDFAPVAEFFILSSSYYMWKIIETTPQEWRFKDILFLPSKEKNVWMLCWLVLAFWTYLGFKAKADVKLLPLIVGLYILYLRPRQIFLFTGPLVLMGLLAVPWGPGLFSKVPPFLPGSSGSEISWMWQPASLERLRDFIWSQEVYSFSDSWKTPTLALSGIFGPFLLFGLMVLYFCSPRRFSIRNIFSIKTSVGRARFFCLIWLAVIALGVSALPEINYTFRVRYGILTTLPACFLLITLIAHFFKYQKKKLNRYFLILIFIILFGLQTALNFSRSVEVRKNYAAVITAVDQVYSYVEANTNITTLILFPDFLPYDYWRGVSPAIDNKISLRSTEDFKQFVNINAHYISWSKLDFPELNLLSQFSACNDDGPFERIFGCAQTSISYLYENQQMRQN